MAKYKNFAELKINDFRAIKSADINLNGITVVSGINGCDKTTMSKMVYNIYKGITEINKDNYIFHFFPYWLTNALQPMQFELKYINFFDKCTSSDENDFQLLIKRIKEDLSKIGDKEFLLRILQESLKSDSEDIVELGVQFCILCRNEYQRLKNQADNRDYSIMKWHLGIFYPNDNLSDKVVFSEYGKNVIGLDIDRVPLPYAVSKVFYIESPYTIDKNLEYSLKNNNNHDLDVFAIDQINDFIKGQSILNGSSSYDKMRDIFFYKSNNISIELSDAATGIRSFSTIQMLLKNGWLGPRTLLIIDEPEAHLHPQWIVEYAKLIVMLHKRN